MSAAKKRIFEVSEDTLEELVDALSLARGHSGWVNATPGVPEDYPQLRGSLFSWLTGPTPPGAPLVTLMPGHGGQPDTLGILHAKGRLGLLRGGNMVSVPASWRCQQDHNRRGLLFEVPAVTDGELAQVMISTCDELATIPTTGSYLIELFTKS